MPKKTSRVMLSLPPKHCNVLEALAIDAETSKTGFVKNAIERLAMERTGMTVAALSDMLERRTDTSLPMKP